MNDRKKIIIIILGALIISNFFAWTAVFNLNQTQFLEVDFFDVGQGDAAFIKTPEGHQILIDGGPNSSILEKLGNKMPFGDRTIDLIILSHPELDHMAGLIEVLKNYKVENILWTGISRDSSEFKTWMNLIKKEGANIFLGSIGRKVIAGEVEFKIIHPLESLSGKIFKDSNNSSLVLQLIFRESSFLFTGDILKLGEQNILQKNINIDSDILKISHHGSKTSTGEEFINKVSPEFAVISVGKNNSYGHPHQSILDTLNKFGITILRTDERGDIEIISDGHNLKLKN